VDPVRNPYRPGAGRRPPLLAGRESALSDFDTVRRRAEELGEGDRSWVLTGLRGVGKTALLNALLGEVGEQGWITAKVEAGAPGSLPVMLSRALQAGLRAVTGRHPAPSVSRMLRVFQAFSLRVDPSGAVSLGVDIEPLHGTADSGRFADDLAGLLEVLGATARDLSIGVLLLIDELQEASAEELRALNSAVHELGQADHPLPVTVVGAGLPSLPAQLADATSYAERLYDYRSVGLLDEPAAADALVLPANALGVSWAPEALEAAVATARGYPYFLQAVGKHVWDAARESPIDLADVRVGLAHAQREVDDGLYRSRWERATPAQKQLLRALARVGGAVGAPTAELARELGRRPSDLSVARVEVIRKGLVYAPERGLLAFTVPGMHEFVDRQD